MLGSLAFVVHCSSFWEPDGDVGNEEDLKRIESSTEQATYSPKPLRYGTDLGCRSYV